MDTPQGLEVTIESLKAAEGMRVELLGRDEPLKWEQSGSGLTIKLDRPVPDSTAVCLKMTPGPE
jgi:hypothetical protein